MTDFHFVYLITTANFTSLIFRIHTRFSCPDHQITLTYALIRDLIDFFRCSDGFGKFWSSGAFFYLTDFVVVGDLLTPWKISSDMSEISDYDRDP